MGTMLTPLIRCSSNALIVRPRGEARHEAICEIQVSSFLGIWHSGLPEIGESVFLAASARPDRDGRCPREALLAGGRSEEAVGSGSTEKENKTLNFSVSVDFKKEFKGFAGSHGLPMTELLKEGFALSKKQRQK